MAVLSGNWVDARENSIWYLKAVQHHFKFNVLSVYVFSQIINLMLMIRVLTTISCVQNESEKKSVVKTQKNKVAMKYPIGLPTVIPANKGK